MYLTVQERTLGEGLSRDRREQYEPAEFVSVLSERGKQLKQ